MPPATATPPSVIKSPPEPPPLSDMKIGRFEAAEIIQKSAAVVVEMRKIRDKCLWREGGFRSFREFCVTVYGEGIGSWLEANL